MILHSCWLATTMLIFWKSEITDPKFNTSTYKLTELDRIVNYSVGTLLLFCFLISTILNPVIWYYHRSADKNKITTFLFSYLAIADFLTNLIAPLGYCYLLMSPKLFSEFDLEQAPFYFLSCTLGCFSQCLATLLAVTRTLKIINPFVLIRKRVLRYYILAYNSYMLINNISVNIVNGKFLKRILDGKGFSETLFFIILIFLGLCYILNALHCLSGMIFSIISVVYVYILKPVSQNDAMKKRACITILLMNVAYIILIVCVFLNALQSYIFKQAVNFTATSFIFIPILTSALNPIILFTRVQKIRQTFYSCFAKKLRNGRITPAMIDEGQINVQNSAEG